jgi:hypothetical protein
VRGVLKHAPIANEELLAPSSNTIGISDAEPLLRSELTNDWLARLSNEASVQDQIQSLVPLIPAFDLDTVELVQLANSKTYLEQAKATLVKLDEYSKIEPLFSWYYPAEKTKVWPNPSVECVVVTHSLTRARSLSLSLSVCLCVINRRLKKEVSTS